MFLTHIPLLFLSFLCILMCLESYALDDLILKSQPFSYDSQYLENTRVKRAPPKPNKAPAKRGRLIPKGRSANGESSGIPPPVVLTTQPPPTARPKPPATTPEPPTEHLETTEETDRGHPTDDQTPTPSTLPQVDNQTTESPPEVQSPSMGATYGSAGSVQQVNEGPRHQELSYLKDIDRSIANLRGKIQAIKAKRGRIMSSHLIGGRGRQFRGQFGRNFNSGGESETSEFDLFCSSLAPKLRRIASRDMKLAAEIQFNIYKIFFEAEMKSL